MEKYIFILFLLFNNSIFAQTNYFSDTINNGVNWAYGLNILPITPNRYALLKVDYDPQFYFNYIDEYGNKIGQKKWIIDATKNTLPTGYATRLKSGNWVFPIWLQTPGTINNYAGLVKINTNLEDTIQTKIFQYQQQGVAKRSRSKIVKVGLDSTYLWCAGEFRIDNEYTTPFFITRCDTNFNIISHTYIQENNKVVSPHNILARKNNACITSLVYSASFGSNADNIRICKVNDNGVIWSKNYGNPNKIDANPYLFKGVSDTTFWLVYTEGRTDTISTGGDFVAIRFRAVLLTDSGVELMSKYLVQPIKLFAYHQLAIPLADGGYLFGFLYRSNKAIFQKYNANFNLVWQSSPYSFYPSAPLGDYINPLHAVELPNGDFICTGEYSYDIPTTIWIGKMDSTGCWYDTGCAIPTPTLPEGEERMQVKISPNPCSNYLTVNIENTNQTKRNITLTDVIGQTLFVGSTENNNITISTEHLPNGTYFLRIENSVNISTQKVIIFK